MSVEVERFRVRNSSYGCILSCNEIIDFNTSQRAREKNFTMILLFDYYNNNWPHVKRGRALISGQHN